MRQAGNQGRMRQRRRKGVGMNKPPFVLVLSVYADGQSG